jgi:hypothetical protein
MYKRMYLTCSLVLLIALTCATVSAQTGTSNISGSVTDATGAAVPGALVTAIHDATGVKSSQTTTDSGLFAFSSLPVGTYTVTVEKQGFKTLLRTNNTLEVGTPLAVDVSLEVGAVEEKVTPPLVTWSNKKRSRLCL